MDPVEPPWKRPPLPQPIAWLYVIAIFVAVVVLFACMLIVGSVGFPAATGTVAALAGGAVGAFVPALLGHGVVIAIHDLRWRRGSRSG